MKLRYAKRAASGQCVPQRPGYRNAMPDEPMLEQTLKELRRKWKTPRPLSRVPDTEQNRRRAETSVSFRYHPKQCARCNRPFFAYDAVTYCSRECQQADRNERRREQRQDRKPISKPIKCARCGKRVPPERSTRRYCSDACRQATYRQRQNKEKR